MFVNSGIQTKFWFVRLISVVLVQTWFVPDECWQSLEVAHRLTFGYGYLTWEWIKGIRSWLYPLCIATIYKLLEIVNLDHRLLLIHIPRLLQLVFTARAEWLFFRELSRLFSAQVAQCFLFLQTFSWFLFYTSPRTLGNTFELGLGLYGLYFYLRNRKGLFILCVALSVYNRPTSGAYWIPFIIYFTAKEFKWICSRNATIVLLKCLLVIGMLVCIDSWLYGRWILVPFRFLHFNFFSNAASYYGTHSWHWYLSMIVPIFMGPSLLALVMSPYYVLHSKSRQRTILLLFALSAFSYIFFHSLVSHKEIRFLSPALPLLNTLAAYSLMKFRWRSFFLLLVILANVPVAIYFSVFHQRGVMDAADELATRVTANDSVLFLMPCHSMPYYSHLHVNASLRFLTCTPPEVPDSNYMDEAEQFYANPIQWMEANVGTSKPDFLVMFDQLVVQMESYLQNHGYSVSAGYDHLHVGPSRIGDKVLIWKRNEAI